MPETAKPKYTKRFWENPNLKFAGYEAKTKCNRLYQGEEGLDCMDENLNKYKK